MSEIPGENSPNRYEGLTAKEIEILEDWEKKAASQPNNFAALNRKGRKA